MPFFEEPGAEHVRRKHEKMLMQGKDPELYESLLLIGSFVFVIIVIVLAAHFGS